jgi:hypothetical protein
VNRPQHAEVEEEREVPEPLERRAELGVSQLLEGRPMLLDVLLRVGPQRRAWPRRVCRMEAERVQLVVAEQGKRRSRFDHPAHDLQGLADPRPAVDQVADEERSATLRMDERTLMAGEAQEAQQSEHSCMTVDIADQVNPGSLVLRGLLRRVAFRPA